MTDNQKTKVIALTKALKKAREAANKFSAFPDGGTCNLDKCVIKLPRWNDKMVEEVTEESGIRIGDKLSGSWWNGYRFVSIGQGQAARNTKMAEAATESLKKDGFHVMMYYQMD